MILESELLAPYLPYKIKALFPVKNGKGNFMKVIGTIGCVYADGSIVCHDTVNATPDTFKLILRPLSDLWKEIGHDNKEYKIARKVHHINGFTMEKIIAGHAPYNYMSFLFEFHFDVFGLIEKGLAIDIKTIKS